MAEKAIRLGGESTADAIVSAVDSLYPEHTFEDKEFALKHNDDEISVDTNFAAQNFWKEALIRFFNKKSAVLGLILIVVIVLLAVFGPGMNSYTYSGQDLSQKNFAPRVPGIERLGILDGSEKMSTTTGSKSVNAYVEKGKDDVYYWFGSDLYGRDIWTRTWEGARVSLIIAVAAAVIDMVIGMSYGLISGYFGGRVDMVMQRFLEVANGIPRLVIVTLLLLVLQPGMAASTATGYDQMYWAMLLNLLVYMPTLSLANTVSYNALEQYKCDLIKDFPPIRGWGTSGFICAMWAVDLTGFKNSSAQLYVGAISALLLGVYSFTLPACKPAKTENKSLLSAFGLDALVLFKRKKMAIFFLFSMLLGAALQITNTYGDLFLGSFAGIPEFADSFGVKHSVILLSISQMSETLFILAIPFFLKHFGIKQVMLISMFAWVFRFGLFGFGDPGGGLWMLILSMIVYGMAFDFFNISGSLFVEQETNSSIRASAQGLFFMMTNGLGAIIGGYASGAVVDAFSVYADGKLVSREWTDIWLIFAAYALVIGILFALVFKYKHRRESKTN